MYMALEILIKSRRLQGASIDSLKRVDVWAFGMVLFNLVNPNLKYPFQLDLVKESPILEQLPDILEQQNHPSDSLKYAKQRETIWAPIVLLKQKCLMFDPASRPSASEIRDEFTQLLAKQTEATNDISFSRADGWLVCFRSALVNILRIYLLLKHGRMGQEILGGRILICPTSGAAASVTGEFGGILSCENFEMCRVSQMQFSRVLMIKLFLF